MSFVDKIKLFAPRPGPEGSQDSDASFWMKTGARGLGTVGGFLAIVFGLLNCVGIFLLNVPCLIAGIWQMLAGFTVIVSEAPWCCFFIDYVKSLSEKMDNRPYWFKAALYVGISLPPFFLCLFSLSTLIGSGLILATGILYGMMALGKKASADDMRTAANLESGLGAPGNLSTAPRSNLVTNEQPTSFTGPPRH